MSLPHCFVSADASALPLHLVDAARFPAWKATQPAGTQVRYKVALFHDFVVPPISDADSSKLYGLTAFAITNFNATTVRK